MALWVKVLAAQSNTLNQMVEVQNQVLHVLWPPHVCYGMCLCSLPQINKLNLKIIKKRKFQLSELFWNLLPYPTTYRSHPWRNWFLMASTWSTISQCSSSQWRLLCPVLPRRQKQSSPRPVSKAAVLIFCSLGWICVFKGKSWGGQTCQGRPHSSLCCNPCFVFWDKF